MKAAVLTEKERIEIQDVDVPEISENEILVKISYCGICTLEQRLYSGAMKIFYPIIPGHEASGIVAAVGSKVITSHRVGDHVSLDLVNRCHSCHYCRTGSSNLCENRFQSGQKVLSGFAEYISIKPEQAFVVPPSLPLEYAAYAEPVSCCIRSLKKIGLTLAEDLLIVGAGPMGLMHLQVASSMGARVFVSDVDPRRLADAEKMGADVIVDARDEELFLRTIREHTENRGVGACVITSPAQAALRSAFSVLANNARVNIYTSYGDKPSLPIDLNTLHRHEYLITGTEGRTEEDFLQAVRLLTFGKIDVAPLISKIVTFDEIEGGIRSAMSLDTYRVLLNTAG